MVFLSQAFELLWQWLALPDVHDTPYLQGSTVSGHAFGSSKGLGTIGTVKQGVQKKLAALRLALFAGSIRMAWLIDCACQAISPGEFSFQEAPRG